MPSGATPPGILTVDGPGRTATWALTKEDIRDMPCGKVLTCQEFGLLEHRLAMRFYPKGERKASSGKCSIFLSSQKSGRIKFKMTLLPGGATYEFDNVFEAGGTWGERDFSDSPTSSEFSISVSVSIFEEEEIKRLQQEVQALEAEKKCLSEEKDALSAAAKDRQTAYLAAQAEVDGLRELLQPSTEMAVERARTRATSASVIQCAWRGFVMRTRRKRCQAEALRRMEWALVLHRLTTMQVLWRRRQSIQRQRREHDAERMGERRPSTNYDAVLAFQSLSEFITTGRIDLLKSAESQFDIAKEAQYRVVAVVGLFDKGKTFLINKLFGVNLPSGKLLTTKGLSFFWIEERRMLVLDSAGVQATVSYRSQAVQPILDAQTTESLVFEMISRIAHFMIFVVNDLTWFEQKYIAMLHQKYVQSNKAKELIVVHNLRSTSVVSEAQELFKRQITTCYDGLVSHLGELVFTQDNGENEPPVHHFGLCDEATAAGRRFNGKNCDFILQKLELGDMLGSRITLSSLLQREMNRLLPIFLSVEPDACGGAPQGQAPSPLAVAYVPESDIGVEAGDGYFKAGTLQLKCPNGAVAMRTRGVISSLGEIIAHDISFDPIVNVYDMQSEAKVNRYIEVECPGVTEDDVELEELPNGVKLIIQKSKAITEELVQPVFPIRQHHGTWERDFSFDPSEGKFEIHDPEEFKLENGILTIALLRQTKPRKWKIGSAPGRAVDGFQPPHRLAAGRPGERSAASSIPSWPATEESHILVNAGDGAAVDHEP